MKEEKIIAFFAEELSLSRLEIQIEDSCLSLGKKVDNRPPIIIRSPWIGWVEIKTQKGQRVRQGKILAIVTMTGVPHEIAAPMSGKITKVHPLKRQAVNDPSKKAVEYYQPLFEIKPNY